MSRRYAVWIAGSVALAACFTLSGMARTKDPSWVAKDWTQWTAQECAEVLHSSPWVKSDSVRTGYGPYLDRDVKLLSALPVRHALLRQIQLEKHYDSMSVQQKQEFDQQHASDLAEGDMLLDITESSGWNTSPDAYFDFKADPPRQAALKVSNYVPSYDSLLMPIQTKILKNGQFENESQYVYPRIVNGKPLLTSNDWFLYIVFGRGLAIDKKTKQAVLQPFEPSTGTYSIKDPNSGKIVKKGIFQFPLPYTYFKVSDLMYKGRLEY